MVGRVFVTGDTHGSSDILKLTGHYWPEGRTLCRDDFLIICGDFGLVWSDAPDDDAAFWLDWLEARPWTTLFLDGNHENHDLLDSYEETLWHGGRVHVLPNHPHVIHLMRGQVYEMGEHGKWFVMGGARSQDKDWRVEGKSWWAREMPSDEEYAEARGNLDAIGWAPDYVFTHDAPTSVLAEAMPWYLEHHEVPDGDELTDFLQDLASRVDRDTLTGWYCGHYHGDRDLGELGIHLLHQQVVELGGAPVTEPGPHEFVPGTGYAIPDTPQHVYAVMRNEGLTMEQLFEYLEGKTLIGTPGIAFVHVQDQHGLRSWLHRRWRRELMEAGPKSDITHPIEWPGVYRVTWPELKEKRKEKGRE